MNEFFLFIIIDVIINKKKEVFVNSLRGIRRSMEMSQYELSRKTQIPQSTLSLIERFYKEPSLKMKRNISRALDCQVEDVFPVQESEEITNVHNLTNIDVELKE